MAYIKGNRNQMTLLPNSIEDYISLDDPVRAYDVFVEALELKPLGLVLDEHQAGANAYWPQALLKLLLYGYAYGLRSSRKLERACHPHLSFIWLTEGLKPDYRTIARFRVENRAALKQILQQCARMCVKLELVEGNTLFTDGTKIKANASYDQSWSQDDCRRWEEKVAQNIERILAECEKTDEQEEPSGSLVKLKTELASQEALRQKIETIKKELEDSGKSSDNTTDPECFVSKADRGANVYHNAQMSVDEKHGLIVTAQVVPESSDVNQLDAQVTQAQEALGKSPQTVCADAGYHRISDIEKIDSTVQGVVPSPTQMIKERRPDKVKPFSKEAFSYDEAMDQYRCPAGKYLTRTQQLAFDKKDRVVYKAAAKQCQACSHFGVCTTSRAGRKIVRLKNEALLQTLARNYLSDEGQRIYKLRKQKVELPFAHFKHNLNMRQFLLRGVDKVNAEFNLCAIAYTITRMIGIKGIQGLKTAFALA